MKNLSLSPRHGDYSLELDTYINGIAQAMHTGEIPLWLTCSKSPISLIIENIGLRMEKVERADRGP